MTLRAGELLADLIKPWPLAFVIDTVLGQAKPHGLTLTLLRLIGSSPMRLLSAAAGALLVLTVVSALFDYAGDRIMNSAGEQITAAIRADTFAQLQRLPVSYHDQQAVGELTSRVSSDTNRIEDSLVDLFSTLLPGVVSIASFAAALLYADWRLGLVGTCTAPLVFLLASRYTRLTRQSARKRRSAEGRMAAMVTESLHGIRTIHAFGRYALHDERFATNNRDTLRAGLRAVELRARFTPLLEAVTALGTAVLLWIGGEGVMRHWWSVGLLTVVLAYLRDMLKPIRSLSQLSITFAQGAASAERILAILDQVPPEPEPITLTAPSRRAGRSRPLHPRAAGRIDLVRVSFGYGRRPVLRNLDLTIEPGERVAVLGANGAGKSTVLSLIAGLLQPTRGRLLIDGIALSELPAEWRHRQIAMVLQDTFLFSGTIAENIRYARPEATDQELSNAAQAGLVTEFTRRLPDGLDTRIADNGVGLSGGQRQRVGIARALLLNAPIVLLDEPTAGLDPTTEQLVVHALTTLAGFRTVIMTTHRPALLGLATRAVYLDEGVAHHFDLIRSWRRHSSPPTASTVPPPTTAEPFTQPTAAPGRHSRLNPTPHGGPAQASADHNRTW
jgi:ABC-type multidrug transport system fused ATPase/permease subunit